MNQFSYTAVEKHTPAMGLVVLQSDLVIESDFRQIMRDRYETLLMSRIPCDNEVTTDKLSQMEHDLPAAVSLFPEQMEFEVVGYGCTSGTAVIGPQTIRDLVQSKCNTKNVTEPFSALVRACEKRNIKNLAFLSPYVEEVSHVLRIRLQERGIETPVFGTFNEAREAFVPLIDAPSIREAAASLFNQSKVDGLFLSCTNLNVLALLEPLSKEFAKPVLSSNQVLAEDMLELANRQS